MEEATKATYPESQYSDYDAFVSQSLEAANGPSNVTKIRKPKTVAYDQIPYDAFDIVINPNILGPVVQFTFSMRVVYQLEKKKDDKENKYYWLTPTGNLRELELEGN